MIPITPSGSHMAKGINTNRKNGARCYQIARATLNLTEKARLPYPPNVAMKAVSQAVEVCEHCLSSFRCPPHCQRKWMRLQCAVMRRLGTVRRSSPEDSENLVNVTRFVERVGVRRAHVVRQLFGLVKLPA